MSKQAEVYETWKERPDLTTEEICKMYGISKNTLYHMCWRERKRLGERYKKVNRR